MPNWCNNNLTVVDRLTKTFEKTFKDYLSKDEHGDFLLDFEKVIPYPKCIKESNQLWEFSKDDKMSADERGKLIEEAKKKNTKECGFESWYEWCVQKWGTKWNCCDPTLTEDGITFTTAWSPPIPVIVELAKLTKTNLRLTYIEEGCGFCGELLANADGTFTDNCYEIPKAPQDLLDELGYEEWVWQDDEDEE